MKNLYRTEDQTAYIRLDRADGSFVETLIDVLDLPKADSILGKWYASMNSCSGKFRAATKVKRDGAYVGLYLHGLILEALEAPPPGTTVDHINRDPLDNRRSNLRWASARLQNMNHDFPLGASGLRGVSLRGSKWRARMSVAGRTVVLGVFESKEEAYSAYVAATLTD